MRLLFLGLIFLGLEALAAAQDFSGAEKTSDPRNVQMAAANEALAAHTYELAAKLLGPLAEQNPKDAHVLFDLGSAQDALDQSGAAEKSYRVAIADDANYPEPRVALGLLLARSGRMEDARTELLGEAGLTISNKPLRGRVLRALARIDEKARPAIARDELLAALQISPETPEDTLLAAELAGSAGDGQDAAEATYRKLLATTPNAPEATAALAHLLVKEKKFSDAETLLLTALEAHPADEALTIQLAAAYTADGKRTAALPLVEQLHASNPADATVSRLLVNLYVDAKDYAHAEPLLAPLVVENPRDGEVAELEGEALIHAKRYSDAVMVLSTVVADPSSFPSREEWGQAAFQLAFVASENNQPALVLKVLAIRAKFVPSSAPMLFLMAISEDKLHQIKIAKQAYQDFLVASNGALPDEEFEARHRLVTLEKIK